MIMTTLQKRFPDLCLLWYFYRAGINQKLVPAHWIGNRAWFDAFITHSISQPRRRDFGLFVMGKLPADLNEEILRRHPDTNMLPQDDFDVREGMYKSELTPEDLLDDRISNFIPHAIRTTYYKTSTDLRARHNMHQQKESNRRSSGRRRHLASQGPLLHSRQ